MSIKACLHVPSPSPSPCHHGHCQMYIVWIVIDCLTDRLGSEPILYIKRSISIGTMLNFDGDCDCDRHGDGDGTCKQPFNSSISHSLAVNNNLWLPSATVVAERLCFHKRLSFCPKRGGVHPLGRHPSPWPGRHHPGQADTSLAKQTLPGQADNPWPSRHPTQFPQPGRHLLAKQTPPQPGRHPLGQIPTAADDMHPTGMYSCF